MGHQAPKGVTGGVEALLKELGVTVVPFGAREWSLGVDACRRFGRGRHAASLNYGDCPVYAIAGAAGDSLLFVGDEFSKAGITPA